MIRKFETLFEETTEGGEVLFDLAPNSAFIKLEISGEATGLTLHAYGIFDKFEPSQMDIGVISANTFTASSSISGTGIYTIDTSGYDQVAISVSDITGGTATIKLKEIV